MNNIIHIIQHTARAATVLLLALLTAQTAWADGISYLDATGTQQSCTTYTTVESSSTSWNSGWCVVNSNTTISERITVSGTVNLILTNNATLTASKGITVGSDATLNIYAQTDDEASMGALVADATNDNANWYAGIGGVENTDAGTITINGGKINATGWCAAGIGSGGGTSTVGTITINGGIVTAQDNAHYGAGIGGGFNGGKASTINLNGGIINAAGIGSGYMGGDCSITVNISDGIRKIVATPVQGGACIGKGASASGTVTVNFISGGNIVTGDDKDAVFYDSGEGTERQIRAKALNHTVSMSDDLKANITVNTEYALVGETITLTLGTAVDASTLKVNDGTSDLTLTDAGNRQYTFTMPDGDVTVTATVLQTYAVNLPANMEVVGATNAADANGKYITGTTVTFKASFPYVASDVSDGTNTLTAEDGVYSVTVADADIIVTATFGRSSTIDLTDASGDFAAINNDVLTGTTSHTVTIADGANITLNNATISGSIICEGSATITLVGTNSVSGATNKAGIQIGGSGTTLTIRGDGSLTANGGAQSAGIGLSRAWNPDDNVIGGDIVIEGGNITANGGSQWGAGIGTGVIYGKGSAKTARIGDITIKGGTVKATGGTSADGIGTGYTYSPCTNTIGTVTIYDGIDMVDASSIKNSGSIVYKHDETDVTASTSDYFTIIENGNRLIIVQKVTPTTADVPDQTYTGSAITPEPLVQTGSLSLTKGTDYEYSYSDNTNVGTATVTVTFKGDYASLGSVNKTFTIVKATPTVTAPTPVENLVFTGLPQTLVTAGSTDFGTLLYSTDGENYSTDIPTGTAAGTYTVYYKVEGSDNWNAVDAQTVEVTITPRNYTVTFDANGGEGTMEPMQLTYDGDWATLTANAFTRSGYGFNGWNTKADGSGTAYSDEEWVKNLTTETSIVLYAQWGKDIATCTATVPDQTMGGYSYIYYKFEAANYNAELAAAMGVVVKDDDVVLTLGTDYEFGNVVYADGTEGMPLHMGDECLLEIKGKGNYAGSLWAPFTITVADAGGTWGELAWAFHAGTLTISGTGAMNAASDYSGYPWFSVASNVKTITIGEGVTTIADAAFAGTSQINYYSHVATASLPTTLTAIGDDAFAYCNGLTIAIPSGVTISSSAFYQVGCVVGTLSNAADNTDIIGIMAAAQSADVQLQGRTLYKDGSWNTLCLPFSVSTASGTLSGDGVQAMTLNTTTSNLADGTLTLNFTATETIPAGTPFIIKWDNTGVNIENPVFEDVTISNATNDATIEDVLTFTGTYAPVTTPDGGDNTKLYLGSANKLYYPNAAMTIGTHRAYFQLADGITASPNPSQGGGNQVRAFVLNFDDDEATGIITTNFTNSTNSSNEWYTLDGVKLAAKPTAKGLYIHGGKKVAIK